MVGTSKLKLGIVEIVFRCRKVSTSRIVNIGIRVCQISGRHSFCLVIFKAERVFSLVYFHF